MVDNTALTSSCYHLAPVPTVGLGAQDEVLPLSVIGQTGRLIDEATAINNLSQMYIGWMPWM